jgi:hypothetical protein
MTAVNNCDLYIPGGGCHGLGFDTSVSKGIARMPLCVSCGIGRLRKITFRVISYFGYYIYLPCQLQQARSYQLPHRRILLPDNLPRRCSYVRERNTSQSGSMYPLLARPRHRPPPNILLLRQYTMA